jgi:hypothetical protein
VQCLCDDDREGYSLKSKIKNPFPSGYHPELDMMDELGPELASCIMPLIGILCWCVELGQIDIHLEVSLLRQYQANWASQGSVLYLFISEANVKTLDILLMIQKCLT